jgi:uncharacterized membrane protein YfcA
MDFIFLAALMTAAGFINTVAGGGGIITVPAYMAFGLPPWQLLGTNKLSACMGACVAAYKMRKRLRVSRKLTKTLVIYALVCSLIGAAASRLLNPDKLKFLVLIFIPATAYIMLSNKNLGREETRRRLGLKKSTRAAKTIAGWVAAYDGFFGPGTGTMFAVFLVKYAGFELVQATAMSKLLNLCSNFCALMFFLSVGTVNFKLGLTMGLFNIAGSFMGAYLSKKKGAAVIRPLVILVCFSIVIRLVWDFFK